MRLAKVIRNEDGSIDLKLRPDMLSSDSELKTILLQGGFDSGTEWTLIEPGPTHKVQVNIIEGDLNSEV